ncbi:GNAT family N-acetyltransferase [Buchananella felis]|uniref:GNAT family N-acetyltransferase n=1 Tax=Buchananella felis TaxID=3231492 RepID=UPI003529C761
MRTVVKHYRELTRDELYAILQVRAQVFVLEQSCLYPDADGLDPLCLHVWLEDDGQIVAYLRALPPGAKFAEASLGRILTTRRRQGLGTAVVRAGLAALDHHFGTGCVRIEAQTQALAFYQGLGFTAQGEPFLDAGIEHVEMLLTPPPEHT